MTKRSVSTDALETLGTIIDEKEKRDAIHLAVLPVVAGESLRPGEAIGLDTDNCARKALDGLGIVDPFLKATVRTGERFWMILKPRLVTSLRHVWTHPAFPEEIQGDIEDAKRDLERIAGEVDCEFEKLIQGAHDWLDSGDYLSEGGRWEGTWLPDEFWPAFEIYTGRKVPKDQRDSFFSCSC